MLQSAFSYCCLSVPKSFKYVRFSSHSIIAKVNQGGGGAPAKLPPTQIKTGRQRDKAKVSLAAIFSTWGWTWLRYWAAFAMSWAMMVAAGEPQLRERQVADLHPAVVGARGRVTSVLLQLREKYGANVLPARRVEPAALWIFLLWKEEGCPLLQWPQEKSPPVANWNVSLILRILCVNILLCMSAVHPRQGKELLGLPIWLSASLDRIEYRRLTVSLVISIQVCQLPWGPKGTAASSKSPDSHLRIPPKAAPSSSSQLCLEPHYFSPLHWSLSINSNFSLIALFHSLHTSAEVWVWCHLSGSKVYLIA